jgi:hypothetical protein
VALKLGKPDVSPDAPSHTRGTKQGNEGPFDGQRGHNADGTVTAERSTGVNSGAHNPIDPRMPNLPPA